jgi:hypothetical protein
MDTCHPDLLNVGFSGVSTSTLGRRVTPFNTCLQGAATSEGAELELLQAAPAHLPVAGVQRPDPRGAANGAGVLHRATKWPLCACITINLYSFAAGDGAGAEVAVLPCDAPSPVYTKSGMGSRCERRAPGREGRSA